MLYREIIAVCFQFQTKHTNILCGQNVELLNVKLVVHFYLIVTLHHKRNIIQIWICSHASPSDYNIKLHWRYGVFTIIGT
jgi:hypothetical protein